MINRQQLLSDLKPIVRAMETDLRARCDEVPQIDADLKKEYEQARAADRTGVTYEEWRADLITQVAVAWVLSCVFVRFLEDNALIAPPRVSGPLHGAGTDAGLMRARDERETYFKTHAKLSDRDYLLTVFDDLAKSSGTKDVFGAHNVALAYRNWLSGDAAQKLIEFFQKIDADGTGEIIHDFTDPNWDTRFLGDLYQDLSEAARKKYALLQTPIFVEEFILDRTLEPAIAEFGLRGFKMIDPACGSGHFLLGGFVRLLNHWRKAEPATADRELVLRALGSVYGVDLNPYAIAIARFRLLLAAMRECHATKLKDAPTFTFNLACGDSLLHGERSVDAGIQGDLYEDHPLQHVYATEDRELLVAFLKEGQYHAVVANPPYITPKDAKQNALIRLRYGSCHMKYALSVPFMERLFELAIRGDTDAKPTPARGGFTGQITSNSFMKREFGKKLVETHLRLWDLTHVIDTAGAYIPGHGTPTVILFGRNRMPVAPTVRAVMGIKGEPATPADPAKGEVWSAILRQIDQPGSQSVYVSVADTPREQFLKHPWSIGGGGAADLKELVDEAAATVLADHATSIGITSFPMEDGVFLLSRSAGRRHRLSDRHMREMIVGDAIRDWTIAPCDPAVFPYSEDFDPLPEDPAHPIIRYLWLARTVLANSKMFAGRTKVECGLKWYEYGRLTSEKLRTPLSIAYGEVATHNHFVLDHGGRVFKNTVQVIKMPKTWDELQHASLVGLCNSSLGCFWLKQISHNKGSTVDDQGARQRTAAFEDFYQFNGTKLQQFPLPEGRPTELARQIDALARERAAVLPGNLLSRQDSGGSPNGSGASPSHSGSCRSDSGASLDGSGRSRDGSGDSRRDSGSPRDDSGTSPNHSGTSRNDSGTGRNDSGQGPADGGDPPQQSSKPLSRQELDAYRQMAEAKLGQMIALQEELDWQCYGLYGVVEAAGVANLLAKRLPPALKLGERAFEIALARKIKAGEEETTWFARHGSTPITEIPAHWPAEYRQVVRKRIDLIESDKNIGLIERPEYKRRWNLESWEEQEQQALRGWLLDRLESYFDLDGRMSGRKEVTAKGALREPKLTSVAQVADLARADKDFMQVAEVFAGRMDFDVGALVGELLAAESVPALPILRYKATAMDKRRSWERTWELQRLEDAVDALFDVERLKKIGAARASTAEATMGTLVTALPIDAAARRQVLREAVTAATYVVEAVKQKLNLADAETLKPVTDAATRAKKAAVGDIPVPPKYTSADFLSGDVWRLRGKLDVPKERWVSFPNCEGEDGTLVIAWAGYDHLQLARAIAERYELAKEQQGRKLVPLLAAIGELIPWLKQWHNDPDPNFGGTRMGNYYEEYLAQEAKALGMSVEKAMAWTPPEKPRTRGTRKVSR